MFISFSTLSSVFIPLVLLALYHMSAYSLRHRIMDFLLIFFAQHLPPPCNFSSTTKYIEQIQTLNHYSSQSSGWRSTHHALPQNMPFCGINIHILQLTRIVYPSSVVLGNSALPQKHPFRI